MEKITRKPFQGVLNIIRFNWHNYVIAIVLSASLFLMGPVFPANLWTTLKIILFLVITGTVISLLVSWYIYDRSELYSLDWLDRFNISEKKQLINITAGFDETSSLLAQKYPGANLVVFDFYDPVKHTEISIKRARKAYPAYPGTKIIQTTHVPLNQQVDHIFLLLAAHEIRNEEERILFFRQLGISLTTTGKIVIAEHQRDLYNFLAYNFGFFHFLSNQTWKRTFTKAGLSLETVFKITPFISVFVLTKNGTPS